MYAALVDWKSVFYKYASEMVQMISGLFHSADPSFPFGWHSFVTDFLLLYSCVVSVAFLQAIT